MTQQRAQTTAYVQPAESMRAPDYQPGLTHQEALDSVLSGFGLALVVWCAPLLASALLQLAFGYALFFIHPAIPLSLGGLWSGWLLFKRHSNDYIYVAWELERQIDALVLECAAFDQQATNERNRAQHYEAQLELLRGQKTTTERKAQFVPYSGPHPSEMPDNYIHDAAFEELNSIASGVDVEPEEDEIDQWISAILRHHEQYGHMRRDGDGGVMKAQNLTRAQFDAAKKKLIDLGIVGGSSATGYHVLSIDYDDILSGYFSSKYAR